MGLTFRGDRGLVEPGGFGFKCEKVARKVGDSGTSVERLSRSVIEAPAAKIEAPTPLETPAAPLTGRPLRQRELAPKGPAGWAHKAQVILQKFRAPVAAALLGATGLPFAGGALAQSAPAEVVAPITIPAGPTGAVVWEPGPVQLGGVWQTDLAQRWRTMVAQQRQYAAAQPTDPVIHRDLLQLEALVAKVDRLFDKQLPANLLADLEHLEQRLRSARPGELQLTLDRSWATLPSLKIPELKLPGLSLDTPRLDAPSSRRLPGSPPLLRQLLLDSPTNFPEQAQVVLQTYGQLMANADRSLDRYPDFRLRTRTPLAYRADGATLLIPPGATLVHQDGQLRIEAPNLFWQKNGLTVVAERGSINLGQNLDGLVAERVDATGRNWSAQLTGATLGISRSSGIGLIQAKEAQIDLVNGTAQLTDGQLLIGPNGDANLLARHLVYRDDRFQLDVAGLRATQTRSGTSASADRLQLTEAGTLIRGERLELSFDDQQTRVTAGALEVLSGRTQLTGNDVVLTTQRIAGGGQSLSLSGEQFRLGNGANVISGEGQAQLELSLDKNGQLRSGRIQGETVELLTGDHRARLDGGNLEVALDEAGHLRSLTSSSHRTEVTGDNFKLDGDQTRLLAHFDAQGRLQDLSASGAAVNWTGPGGALQAQDGAITGRFQDGLLSQLSAEASKAHWAGTDGTKVDAERGRLDLSLHGNGALSELKLQSGNLSAELTGGQRLQLSEGQGLVKLRPDGTLERIEGKSGQLALQDGAERLSLSGLKFGATFDAAGHLSRATGEASQLRLQRGDGTFLGSGKVRLDVLARGDRLERVGLYGENLEYKGALGNLSAAQGRLELALSPSGQLSEAQFNVRELKGQGKFGDLALGGEGWLKASFNADGTQLTGLSGHADRLDWSKGAQTLALVDGNLALQMDGDRVQSAEAQITSGSYRGDFGALALANGSHLRLEYLNDGRTKLDGQVGRLELAKDGGQLVLQGGRVSGELAADGTAQRLLLGADQIRYQGRAEGDHPLAIDLAGPQLVLSTLASGGQQLDVQSGAGHFQVDGHRVALDGLSGLTLATTPTGEVDTFAARFPGALDFHQRDGELSVLTRGLGASYQKDGSELRLDFQSADVALRSQGLTARIEGAEALLNEGQLNVRIDKAQVLRTLGEQLDVQVEAVTLQVARGPQGGLQGLDVSLGRMDAHIAGMDVWVRTPLGEAVRLHVGTDAEGRTIKEAFLQIPEGGELRLAKDDLSLRLGGQRISFDHGDDGIYRLRGESLDIQAVTKSATVSVTGGDAQVNLDPATGRLVIDHIRGTRVDVLAGGQQVQLDVQELERFMVRMTKLEGGATGAALHLIPVDDGSRLTAEIRAELGGVPVSVQLQNLHELKAIGQLSVNQVQVYVGDPSGQGQVKLGVGPLELKGSAVEVIGRYHPHDPGRLTESLHQFLTTNGTRLFSGVSFESDGVLRLGTDRDGLNGELAVILPRQYALPGYRLELTSNPSAAFGVIGTVGYRQEDLTASVFAGLVPGSHLTLNLNQGSATLAGIPLPKQSDWPTTAIGGLRLDLDQVKGGRLGVIGGGYLNPAGLANNQWIKEDRPYGGFVGLEYQKGNLSLGASATIDVDRQGKAELGGVIFTLGVTF